MLAATKTIIQGIPMSHIAIGLSVVCFLFVLPAILEPKKVREALEDFFRSGDTIIRLGAFIHFLVAFLILNTHWTIKFNSTRTIMTVLGYLILLRGILWLWVPSWVAKVSEKWLKKEGVFYAMIFVGLVFALGLGYLGLWVY